jgi:DNA-binding CsgD family transcriptional regulator
VICAAGKKLEPAEAARVLAGLPLDRAAVRAVLDAAGTSSAVLPSLPVGLTERELDVLRLLAAGRTMPQIAGDLVISQSTVQTNTVHIYAKCGVSTRAGLAMFAMRHGLAARTGPAAAKSTEQSIAMSSAPCSERSPAATSPRSATCSTPAGPGTTTTTTASAASTVAPMRSSPT